MIGETVGSYKLLARLGVGGMGEVYLAEHKYIARRAAIKFLLPELSRSKEVIGRFCVLGPGPDVECHRTLTMTGQGGREASLRSWLEQQQRAISHGDATSDGAKGVVIGCGLDAERIDGPSSCELLHEAVEVDRRPTEGQRLGPRREHGTTRLQLGHPEAHEHRHRRSLTDAAGLPMCVQGSVAE